MSIEESGESVDSSGPEFDQRLESYRARSLSQRILDWFFGYDYFISYRWSDGRTYALALAEELSQRGFVCFLDSEDYAAGDDWTTEGERSLKNTSILVLVGSPKIHESSAVLRELKVFETTSKPVVPIDIDESLTGESFGQSPLAPYLSDKILRIHESKQSLIAGPSEATLDRVRDAFEGRRQKEFRRLILRSSAGVFTALIIAALVLAVRGYRMQTVRLIDEMLANSANEVAQGTTDEFLTTVESMRDRWGVVSALRNRIGEILPDGDNVDSGKKRADLAITLVHLGQLDAAVRCLCYRDTLAETISQFASRCRTPGGLEREQLIDLAEHAVDLQGDPKNLESADLAAYSALLGIGEFRDQSEMPDQFLIQLKEGYRGNPSRAIHSACGWLLGNEICDQLNAELAQEPSSVDLAQDRHWFIVKIAPETQPPDAGDGVEYLTLMVFEDEKGKFAISDREVTVGLARRIAPQLSQDLHYYDQPPGDDDPVNDVLFDDAETFVDELSKQFADTLRVQLPSDEQWAIAWGRSQDENQPAFQFGNDKSLLPRYAQCGPNPQGSPRPVPVARKRPSMTGMFDVHGNVAEWTIQQSIRGGAMGQDESLCAWGQNLSQPENIGLRFIVVAADRQ